MYITKITTIKPNSKSKTMGLTIYTQETNQGQQLNQKIMGLIINAQETNQGYQLIKLACHHLSAGRVG